MFMVSRSLIWGDNITRKVFNRSFDPEGMGVRTRRVESNE